MYKNELKKFKEEVLLFPEYKIKKISQLQPSKLEKPKLDIK